VGISVLIINYIKSLKLDDKIIEVINTDNKKVSPEASVIIVTYNTNQKLLSQNLDSLKNQLNNKFEIIIVDNSDKKDVKSIVSSYSLKYIKLNKNYGLSLARNIGIKFARGDIVIFLDDDAIPAKNFVKEHIRAHNECNILGLRGKSLPRTSTIYNYLVSHYDYGNQIIPSIINLEGNSSFKRDMLIEIGGFNPELLGAGGYEGLELTYRIIKKYEDKNKLIYYPNTVIYHDYSSNFIKYLKKALRHAKYRNIIEAQFKDIFKFFREYHLSPKNSKRDVPGFPLRLKIAMIRKITVFAIRVQKIIDIFTEK